MKGGNNMKVYVMTKFVPFGAEQFVDVKKSKKEALKTFRELFPNMRGDPDKNNMSSDKNDTYLLRIIEKDL